MFDFPIVLRKIDLTKINHSYFAIVLRMVIILEIPGVGGSRPNR
jgi:hypothetical protein